MASYRSGAPNLFELADWRNIKTCCGPVNLQKSKISQNLITTSVCNSNRIYWKLQFLHYFYLKNMYICGSIEDRKVLSKTSNLIAIVSKKCDISFCYRLYYTVKCCLIARSRGFSSNLAKLSCNRHVSSANINCRLQASRFYIKLHHDRWNLWQLLLLRSVIFVNPWKFWNWGPPVEKG